MNMQGTHRKRMAMCMCAVCQDLTSYMMESACHTARAATHRQDRSHKGGHVATA